MVEPEGADDGDGKPKEEREDWDAAKVERVEDGGQHDRQGVA